MCKYPDRLGENNKGRTIIFPRGTEYCDWEKLSAQPERREKLASAQLMVEKVSCLPEITISPPPQGKNNGPSLKRLLDVSSTHIRFVGN